MMKSDYLEKDTPNFVFKGENALLDHGLIIANELPVISSIPNIDEIKVLGRSRTLTEWHGDYEAYDYPVEDVTIPYEHMGEVQRWLRGTGKLITHNDVDKYVEAKVNINRPVEYKNQWGVFYDFEILFRCQPFKYKVAEQFINLVAGDNIVMDHGMENARPYFEIDSNGGDISFEINGRKLTVLNTNTGLLTVDTESGVVIQPTKKLFSKGDYPFLYPGTNIIKLTGSFKSAKVKLRSVWL